MKRLFYLLTIPALYAITTLSPLTALSQTISGRDIMLKVKERPEAGDIRSNTTMTLVNRRGKTRVRSMVSFSKKYGLDSKAIMWFTEPADVKGIGFLSWEYDDPSREDDRWLFLPALHKARRIAGSSNKESFMGSDFTYDDMGDRNIDEDTHVLLREEDFEGHRCWVVESTPVKESMYSKRLSWIRQDALIGLKVEYYDLQKELLKVLRVSDIKQIEGYWSALKMEMENLADEHKTIIEMSDVNFDTGIEDNLFRVDNLERGRY